MCLFLINNAIPSIIMVIVARVITTTTTDTEILTAEPGNCTQLSCIYSVAKNRTYYYHCCHCFFRLKSIIAVVHLALHNMANYLPLPLFLSDSLANIDIICICSYYYIITIFIYMYKI